MHLRVNNGQLLEPVPTNSRLRTIAPVRYRPLAPRTVRKVAMAGTGACVPASYVDAATAAERLGVPTVLVQLRATHEPQLLPTHVMVDGQPWFDPTSLPGVHA